MSLRNGYNLSDRVVSSHVGRRRISIILCCAALFSFHQAEQSAAQTLTCPIGGTPPLILNIPDTLGCSLSTITTLTGQLANGLPLTSLQAADLIGAAQDVLVTPMLIRRNNLLLSADFVVDRQFEILSAPDTPTSDWPKPYGLGGM